MQLSYSVPTFDTPDFPNRANGQTPNTIIFSGSGLIPGVALDVTLTTDAGSSNLGQLTVDANGNLAETTFTVVDATAQARMASGLIGPGGGQTNGAASQAVFNANDGQGHFIELLIAVAGG